MSLRTNPVACWPVVTLKSQRIPSTHSEAISFVRSVGAESEHAIITLPHSSELCSGASRHTVTQIKMVSSWKRSMVPVSINKMPSEVFPDVIVKPPALQVNNSRELICSLESPRVL